MITYKLQNDKNGNPCAVHRSDGWMIPFISDNTDYQQYLAWVAQGNTPTPADEGTQ
jgi:hypothetical protein